MSQFKAGDTIRLKPLDILKQLYKDSGDLAEFEDYYGEDSVTDYRYFIGKEIELTKDMKFYHEGIWVTEDEYLEDFELEIVENILDLSDIY